MLAIVSGLLIGPLGDASAAVSLESDNDLATAGYYQLQWQASETPTRLVESLDPAFETRIVVYEGPDTASLISGKSDGKYFYRLEGVGPPSTSGDQADVVSNTVAVTVRHHSLGRAFMFFAIGAAVFAATLVLVLFGGRDERRQ